jgi:putative ABC transport system ATP-binding protein
MNTGSKHLINAEKVLEVKDVSVSFAEKLVLDKISLSVDPGDLIVVGGPSGGGKTTLLRLLCRLRDPDGGSISYRGKPARVYDVTQLRRRICYMQQEPVIIKGSVSDNLLIPFKLKASFGRVPPDRNKLKDLMQDFKLNDVSMDDDAQNLSVGQKQRLAFIRILLLDSDILLLDEPMSALDIQSRQIVDAKIASLVRDEGMTIIMVSHIDVHFDNIRTREFNLDNSVLTEAVS